MVRVQRSYNVVYFLSFVIVQAYVFDLVCGHTHIMTQCGLWFVYVYFLFSVRLLDVLLFITVTDVFADVICSYFFCATL